MRRLLPLALLLAASACNKTPDGVIPEEKMADLLADIYVAEAVVDGAPHSFPTDSTRRAFQQSIYMRHGVTAVDVDSSLNWYGHNLSEYMKVCDMVEEKLKARIATTEKIAGQTADAARPMSLDGDSVDLWPGTRYLRVSPTQASDYATFTLSNDKNWERGDRYTLHLKPRFSSAPVTLMIAADYTDGTTEYASRRHTGDDAISLTFVLDSAKIASTVHGYIRYTPAEGAQVSYLDSISLVRTRGRNDNVKARQGQLKASYR